MGTRALIAMTHQDRIRGIYLHQDGYPAGAGKLLDDHYSDLEAVTQLMDLGPLVNLAPTTGKCVPNEDSSPGYDVDSPGNLDTFFETNWKIDSAWLYCWTEDGWYVAPNLEHTQAQKEGLTIADLGYPRSLDDLLPEALDNERRHRNAIFHEHAPHIYRWDLLETAQMHGISAEYDELADSYAIHANGRPIDEARPSPRQRALIHELTQAGIAHQLNSRQYFIANTLPQQYRRQLANLAHQHGITSERLTNRRRQVIHFDGVPMGQARPNAYQKALLREINRAGITLLIMSQDMIDSRNS